MSGFDCPTGGSRVIDSRCIDRATRGLPFVSIGGRGIVCRKGIEYAI